jgi:hypothetical protein
MSIPMPRSGLIRRRRSTIFASSRGMTTPVVTMRLTCLGSSPVPITAVAGFRLRLPRVVIPAGRGITRLLVGTVGGVSRAGFGLVGHRWCLRLSSLCRLGLLWCHPVGRVELGARTGRAADRVAGPQDQVVGRAAASVGPGAGRAAALGLPGLASRDVAPGGEVCPAVVEENLVRVQVWAKAAAPVLVLVEGEGRFGGRWGLAEVSGPGRWPLRRRPPGVVSPRPVRPVAA